MLASLLVALVVGPFIEGCFVNEDATANAANDFVEAVGVGEEDQVA